MSASGRSNKINFCDFDGIKKKEMERRKKLRLEQVRTQSKELSSQIRDRVAREKHRQLRNVEEIKRKELLSWKEKHVNNTMADYYYCLSNVGDAHVAAERENQLTEQQNEQQRKNRKIAVQRGRDALHKERLANVSKKERGAVKRKQNISSAHENVVTTTPNTVNAPEEVSRLLTTNDDDHQLQSDSDDELTAKNVDTIRKSSIKSPEKHLADELVDKPKDSMFQFTKVSDLIEERRRARNVCDQILESEFGTGQPEIQSTSSQKSSQPKSSHAPKSSQPKSSHAPKSPQAKSIYNPKSPKQPTKSTIKRSPVTAKGFVPKLPTAGSKGFNSQRSVVGNARRVISPNKVAKTRNVATSSKFVSPQRREFVPRFNIPGILKNKPAPETTTQAVASESTEKVQFYDHFSRYGKEYEAVPGMVVREPHNQVMDANEAARVQNEKDEIRFKQLEEWKRKTEQRSVESLQRNQVRKDYDNLTKQLDALCKEENRLRAFAMPPDQFSEDRISQLARNRQQSMNRAFEDMHHRPVVITCPPINSNEHSSSSDLNVAASPPTDKQRPHVDPLDSSDSCTSILLGYVDNRSRKLVKDIKQCKDGADGDKRKKLVTLLTRLDGLRKLLMEEIVRNSSLNLEPFYRSVLEVETEQKDILHDPLANKENGDTRERTEPLNLREQSQEMKLEKKIRELFRKEQAKAAALRCDNTFESVTSETTGSRDDPEPVKILIEVKNGAKIRKSSNPKNTDTHIVVAQRERKTSVVSSASTAYRSPPATFHTDFTKVLSNLADERTKKPATEPKEVTSPVKQTSLAHYITRLLGMSQKSVDQLGVSTGSSITTPSDSVIEVAENRSVIDASHLSRVQAKIDDSLRLVKEVDDSFKQPTKQSAPKKVTKTKHNWKGQEVTPSEERQGQTKRNADRHQHSHFAAKTPEKSKKVTHRSKPHSIGGESTEVANIPENSKRIIADLTKQIEQVRQDKQKLLEKTLSSAQSSHSSSGKDFDLTEYKDFVTASKPTSKPQTDENDRSSQASDVQSSPGQFVNEEAKNLMSTKQIGISFSRDSGIGSSRPASRPVTSTDFRISPDIRLAEKSTPSQEMNVVGADLPLERGDPTPEDAVRKSVETGVRKSAKPPISLKRYSPQLDTEQLQPHDLSTINEIETSAASRLNQSTRNETSDSPVPTLYTRFPTFAEYAKMQEIESVDASSDGSYSETILKKMLEVTCLSETDLHYRKLDKTRPKDRTNNEQSTNTGTFSEFIDVEKEIKQRRLMERADASSTSDSKMISSSTSSDILAKDFNRIGLNWASAMLKKTSTAQNLESSSSSIKSTPIAAPTLSGGSSPGDRINGNPLNIRDFLARELLKRSQLSSSSSMSDSSTLTDQFLKSLLTMTSDSSLHQQATLRTSTPNRLNQSSESEKFVPAHDIGHTAKDEHLFSGESVLSSVRGVSQSDETSGGRETSE